MVTKFPSTIHEINLGESSPGGSILRSSTIVVTHPKSQQWRDVLTSFLKDDDHHLAGSYDFDAILRAARDALPESGNSSLRTMDDIVIASASDFRCLLLAVTTGKRALEVDIFGNQCLTFKLVNQATPKAVFPTQALMPPNLLMAAPAPTVLQWSSIGQFGEVVSDINAFLETSFSNLDKVNVTTAKITTVAKRTNLLFEKTSKLLHKLQLVPIDRRLSNQATIARSIGPSTKRAATAAPSMRTSTGMELSPEPFSKMAKRDLKDVHGQVK